MKLTINYKHVESHKSVETEVARHVAKLEKLLQSYSPDLVQLHGAFSKTPRTEETSFTLNLSLPTATLHAHRNAARHRHGLHCANQLQESLQRVGRASEKTPGQVAQRL